MGSMKEMMMRKKKADENRGISEKTVNATRSIVNTTSGVYYKNGVRAPPENADIGMMTMKAQQLGTSAGFDNALEDNGNPSAKEVNGNPSAKIKEDVEKATNIL